MKISILTLFPALYEPFLKTSIIGRARQSGKIDADVVNLFSLCQPKERIDGPTFGPGAGVVLRPEIMEKGIEQQEAQKGTAYKIFFSPQGKKLDQDLLKRMYENIKKVDHVMLLPARYEGMDGRIEEYYADATVSVGDIVLMGGDIPAMILLEGLLRLIPGIVGKEESVLHDSFSGAFVDYPEFTDPLDWKGLQVPAVIRSGNHHEIHEWRMNKAAQKTVIDHFDWLRSHKLTDEERELSQKYIPSHYAALMHNEIVLPGDIVGTTSVTSLDIHDIARSAKTYGLKNYFIVTSLIDQQKIVQKLLDFWQTGAGVTYNSQRHEAVKEVILRDSLDSVIAEIEQKEGKKPIVIATSARESAHDSLLTFYEQSKIWVQNRPVLIIFGTGHGLSAAVLERCDYVFMPIKGISDFNHLSVRSAAAVIFDRWLGLNVK